MFTSYLLDCLNEMCDSVYCNQISEINLQKVCTIIQKLFCYF